MYVGSRHAEIAAMLAGPGETSPQGLPGAPSLPAHTLGRGEANSGGSSLSRRPATPSEQRRPEPRPNLSDAV